jgi:hypothetical protein
LRSLRQADEEVRHAEKSTPEEQIIGALKQYESENVADICRKLRVSQAIFYTWKKQYAGMGAQELRELRQLLEEKQSAVDRSNPCSDDERAPPRTSSKLWQVMKVSREPVRSVVTTYVTMYVTTLIPNNFIGV